MPGPVGKRSDARHGHRTKAEIGSVAKAKGGEPIEWRPAPDHWDPIAVDWYESLARSGQATFYERSDVAAAYYVAEAMSRNLTDGKFSAVLFANVMSAMGDLLTTEADRRRARIELERVQQEDNGAELRILDNYRDMLG